MTAETIVAVSAGGPAPRGVVRMSGPAAFDIAGRAFLPDRPGGVARGARTGRLVLDAAGASCPAELWCFAHPASYTGEDVVECHVPGAPKLLDLVLRRLVALGARPAEPGAFTRRALENGRMDLTRAEAVCALIRARDEDEHRKARSLLDGGLAREMASYEDRLVAILAPIELELDFSDQDVVIPSRSGHAARIRMLAADLAACAGDDRPFARRTDARVVLRGPANAGKSSLFNALLGRDLAIATDVRGTTRDVLVATWRSGAARALLCDTAGDDVVGGAVEEEAARSRARALLEADLVLEVRDLRSGGWPAAAPDAISVGTMRDLLPQEFREPPGVACVSNVTGEGVPGLADRIAAALAASAGRRSESFVVLARHATHVARAREALDRAASVVEHGPVELAASDLRTALRELRAVTGLEGDPVLDRIFRDFCIGK